MKHIFTLLFLLLTSLTVPAQNMLHNPGFEQMVTCPTGFGQVNYAHVVDWDQPNLGSSDYYNVCNTNPTSCSVPANFFGTQSPYEGNAYTGFYTDCGPSCGPELVRGVIDPLIIGQTYQVTVRVSRADSYAHATDGLGVYFYINNTFDFDPTNDITAQVDYSPYGPITDNTNWVTLTDTFTADSAYTHVVIGRLKTWANMVTTIVPGNQPWGYYYLDYVEIVPTSFFATPSHTNVSCYGGNNGTASVTPNNGYAPYTYLWLPGNQTTQSISGLTAGSYTCRVIDATQDTVIDTIVVTEPPLLTATTSQTNINCNGGNSGTATVTASGGTVPYTYLWAPTGGTNATATGLIAGNYTCTITDLNGCTLQKTFTITQPATAVSATTSQVNILCNGGNTGSATVVASGGVPGYTYSWAPSGGTNATASGLTAGNCTCTITDANGCTLQKAFTLTQPTALTATTAQTNITCNAANNGTATVTASGGVPGYTYSWAPSGGTNATATGLAPGSYTCTITDANNCTLQKTFTITQPAVLSATISHADVSCFGGNNGTATVVASGGTPAYTYSWAPSGGNNATANNLLPGTYTCTITDANGCTTTQTAIIQQPAQQLSVFASQTNLACNGASTGIATVIVSGGTLPYSYSWSPIGGNGPNANNLPAGTYTCTITDAGGCNITQTITLTEPPAIIATTSHADILCHGNGNGIATVIVTGGTPPYAYSWAPAGGNGPNATGLAAGIYTCTVTDHNNCVHTETVTINESAALSSVDSQSNVKCYGESSAYAQVIASGGTAPYTYSWLPTGGNADAANGLQAGSYTCSISDYNNCVLNEVFTISQPEQLSARTTKTNVVCQNLNQGVAIAVGTGGTPGYTYQWTPGNSTDTIVSGLGVGKDTCLITDMNGCTYNAVFNIVDTSQPFSYSVTDSALDCRSALLTAVPAQGSSIAITYKWLFADSSTASTNPAAHSFPQAGDQSTELVVVNAVGCHDTINHSFNINYPMLADYTFDPDPPSPNTPVHFHNASTLYATTFNWEFGDGTSSTAKDPEKQYNDSGLFHVCMIASDSNNCIDTVCKDLETDVDKVVGIPNAFSPNGDGENDVLYIRGFRIAEVKLRIYNRWGNLVFETNTKEKGWDGTYKGQAQIAEVYAYTLEATFTDGSTKKITGSISLLR